MIELIHKNAQHLTLRDRLKVAEIRALKMNVGWLLSVQIAFVLFVFCRDYFYVSHQMPADPALSTLLETALVVIMAILCGYVAVLRFTRVLEKQFENVMLVITLSIGVMWCIILSLLFYSDFSHLIFAISTLLMLSSLIALYPSSRHLFFATTPIWAIIVVHAMFFSKTLSLVYLAGYLVFAVLFETGRRLLRRWFVLAVTREHQNVRLANKLTLMSQQDPLTALANRRHFDRELQQAIARATTTGHPLSIILIDVDYFKKYNDRYGHQAGDACLIQLAKRFQQAVRCAQDLVGRYGGEEFIILLPDQDKYAAERVAERLKDLVFTLALPHDQSDVSPYVSLSQGIAQWQNGVDAKTLIENADQALYLAKQQGRNTVRLAP
ncbi:GGDEF domain-containing protein [Hafnia alvei]|uniref:diguanylate cyclase n=1 Tax=Hafnia alvei TaxID=569 RepID=A0A1C6Z1W3_HAFAL|nr:GGDEF domain-containing protein [Hafnia alvei]NLS52109.1 diguanylate cyclase [Hafnia alvei]SCM53163.1 diguanylate cyclase (GGDEF) domain-containing protein [Hafnia alvei]